MHDGDSEACTTGAECNMTRTGWDMDPFAIFSFGKKVFRTRAIGHSRNPIQLSILDWDKHCTNDHIGNASFDVNKLAPNAPQVDLETGLYPACGAHLRLPQWGNEVVECSPGFLNAPDAAMGRGVTADCLEHLHLPWPHRHLQGLDANRVLQPTKEDPELGPSTGRQQPTAAHEIALTDVVHDLQHPSPLLSPTSSSPASTQAELVQSSSMSSTALRTSVLGAQRARHAEGVVDVNAGGVTADSSDADNAEGAVDANADGVAVAGQERKKNKKRFRKNKLMKLLSDGLQGDSDSSGEKSNGEVDSVQVPMTSSI
ncbi:hypothetical protein DFP72DRAFT_1074662 [Ephemerocybe angulata]|uniref:Uncharacterized protein n=1 Tax=Ephemerocybe angulata TaxID=980116 RepID=A0A8H6LXY9_9AGAR|nr:hypothetical protein DFP72DRAFT_1074662 [Tulosesus angulatus]